MDFSECNNRMDRATTGDLCLKKIIDELETIPAELRAEYLRLKEEVAAQEAHGQFNTVHHEALHNIQAANQTNPPIDNKE